MSFKIAGLFLLLLTLSTCTVRHKIDPVTVQKIEVEHRINLDSVTQYFEMVCSEQIQTLYPGKAPDPKLVDACVQNNLARFIPFVCPECTTPKPIPTPSPTPNPTPT